MEARGNRWTLQANGPRARSPSQSKAELAQILGLAETDIGESPLWVSTGREQLVVPLRSAEAVRNARPQGDVFSRLKSEDGQSMAYVFADSGASVESRFFFPSGPAILEDPATGSACANLGGWFVSMQPGVAVERTISQGEAVHRPSTLYLSVKYGPASPADARILVGGDVIELGRGTVSL